MKGIAETSGNTAETLASSNKERDEELERTWVQVSIDREAALEKAERRFRQMPEIVASRSRTDETALLECLDAAVAVVRAHAQPMGMYARCPVRHDGDALCLGRAKVANALLQARVAEGDRAVLYLATVGYTNVTMFEAVERDYVAYHFQYYLSRQLLYVTANQVYDEVRRREGPQFIRWAILDGRSREAGARDGNSAGRCLPWDPEAVADLFAVFEGNPIGVGLTEAKGFNPIDSLLGIMLERFKTR